MSVYFDNAATSYPKPEEVYRAVDDFQRNIGASPGRGTYSLARKADRIVFEARSLLADLFNIKDITRIIFTCNVTESINLALKGLLKEGDHVITTQMEHNAIWRPLKMLESQRNIKISILDFNDTAEHMDEIEPLYESKRRPHPLQLYRWLPQINCGQCGEKTCIAFAALLSVGQQKIDRCTPLFADDYHEQREVILNLVEILGHDILHLH